jgi:hypothetical protein
VVTNSFWVMVESCAAREAQILEVAQSAQR